MVTYFYDYTNSKIIFLDPKTTRGLITTWENRKTLISRSVSITVHV